MFGIKYKVFGFTIALASLAGYGQDITHSKSVLKKITNKFNGIDILDAVYLTKRDTTAIRYFNGGLEVSSDRSWREKMEYKIDVLDNSKYVLTSRLFKKEGSNGEVELIKEDVRYYSEATKGYVHSSKRFLQNDLVEIINSDKDERLISCVDINGNTINDTGCLYYSTHKFPINKTAKLRENIFNVINATLKKKGRRNIPDYIILVVEADYKSKSWILSFDFLQEYEFENNLEADLIANIMYVLNNEKLEDYHFDKDINGNYYNYSMTVPIVFKK